MVVVVIVLMPAPEPRPAVIIKYVDTGSTMVENLLSGNKSGNFKFKKQLNCQIFEIIKITLGY
jgi:hypothetical protein